MKNLYSYLLLLQLCFCINQVTGQVIHVVNGTNFVFTPNNFTAAVGDIVRFRYLSGGNHTTTSSAVPAGAATWDAPLTPAVMQFDYTITAPGTYNYFCRPHLGAGMVATFTVSAVTPVTLVAFKASASASNSIVLTWQTATEENADHFSVQRSNDGINFTEAGRVSAAGNSTSLRTYSLTVPVTNSSQRYVYFRLNTIDRDNKQQYSNIVLYRQGVATSLGFITSVYPVPAEPGDHLHINFDAEGDGTMKVSILDVTGKTVSVTPLQAAKGFNQTHMPLPELKRGAYYLQFDLNGSRQVHPLVIQ